VKLAFIIQRYGADVLGGSEQLCRLVAERLAPNHEVDVLTTCGARLHHVAQRVPEGADRVKGVNVRRFATTAVTRHPGVQRLLRADFQPPHSRAEGNGVLKQQGPWLRH